MAVTFSFIDNTDNWTLEQKDGATFITGKQTPKNEAALKINSGNVFIDFKNEATIKVPVASISAPAFTDTADLYDKLTAIIYG